MPAVRVLYYTTAVVAVPASRVLSRGTTPVPAVRVLVVPVARVLVPVARVLVPVVRVLVVPVARVLPVVRVLVPVVRVLVMRRGHREGPARESLLRFLRVPLCPGGRLPAGLVLRGRMAVPAVRVLKMRRGHREGPARESLLRFLRVPLRLGGRLPAVPPVLYFTAGWPCPPCGS